MKTIITIADLEDAICFLEMRQAEEGKRLKEQFNDTYEMLKPVNIIKSVFHETVESPEIRSNLTGKIMNVALVFLTNMVLKKSTHSIIKRTVGTALVFGIKTILSRNPEMLKAAGNGVMKLISNVITKRNKNKEYTARSI